MLVKHSQMSHSPTHLDRLLSFCPLESMETGVTPHPPIYFPVQPGFQTLLQRGMWTQVCITASEKLVFTGNGSILAGTEHLETLIKVGKEDVFSIFGLDGVLQLWF